MATDGELRHEGRQFTNIFLITLLLTAANYALEIGVSLAFRPASVDQAQLYALVTSFVFFVYNPIVMFAIFYSMGPRTQIRAPSDHLRVLTHSFLGALAGWGVGFLGFAVYQLATQGSFSIGPNTDWLNFSAQLGLALVRQGVAVAFVAFAGVTIGRLRSGSPRAEASSDAGASV